MSAYFEKPRLRNASDDPANPKDGYVLEIKGSASQLFQDWAQHQTDEQIYQYFRSVAEGIAERKLEHYHFKLCNGRWNPRLGRYDQNWHIEIYYGEEDSPKEGPLQVSRCMSCDLDCPLIIGVLGEAAAASPSPALAAAAVPNSAPPPPPAAAAVPSHAPEQPSNSSAGSAEAADCAAECSASAGAAAKPLVAAEAPRDKQQASMQQQEFTVAGETVAPAETDGLQQQQLQQQQSGPVSRDSLVKETEHCRVWWDAKARPMWVVTPKQHLERLADLSQAQLVDLFKTAIGVVKEMGCRSFETMILNHGDSRNHAHLHLKVRIFWKEFASIRAHLPPRLKGQLAALEQFRDQLPAEARGTRAAWQLRQQGRQREQYQREQKLQQRC